MDDVNASRAQAPQSVLNRVFGLSTAGTSLRTELVAGLTTFLTMIYIVFVNPQILGDAGMDKGAVFVATCLAAAVSTLVWRSMPIIRSRSRPAWGSTRSSLSPSC
jgi:xanthine/uracil/vitamin C permease (AzgA family)